MTFSTRVWVYRQPDNELGQTEAKGPGRAAVRTWSRIKLRLPLRNKSGSGILDSVLGLVLHVLLQRTRFTIARGAGEKRRGVLRAK